MKIILITLAQSAAEAIPRPDVIVTVIVSVTAGIVSVWGWFRAELKTCQDDRKTLFDDFKKSQTAQTVLAVRVGQLETLVAQLEARIERISQKQLP